MAKTLSTISRFQGVSTFMKKGMCSHTLICVLNNAYGQPLPTEEKATDPLAGGIVMNGYQCGMLWGTALAAGARAYRLYGAGANAEAMAITGVQEAVKIFVGVTHNIDCLEITDLNLKGKASAQGILKFFFKGGPIKCFSIASKYPPKVFKALNLAFTEKTGKDSPLPVSCAALAARKMGASELHAIMAAGLAGGIGLSGGGCGVLGAAIWLKEMEALKAGADTKAFNDRGSKVIDKFIRNTDFKFECSEITGRKFENAAEHAEFIRGGGCAKIIDLFAAK